MDLDVEKLQKMQEIAKAAMSGLSLDGFKGDVVGFKYVENEFGNIEEGGIGVQHIHYGTDGKVAKTEQSGSSDDVKNRDAIPADCIDAVKKVIVPTITIEGGVVLSSATQIAKAAKHIDLTSNSQVAMLMAIGMEVNSVRPGCTCTDFVRAMIGMRIIAYTDNEAIDTMAGGMTKKLNGYSSGTKQYPPLPSNHQRWNTKDRPIGTRLYDALRSQG